MTKELGFAFRAVLVFTLLLGIVYPLLVTGIAQFTFPVQANGSLIRENGMVIGSGLIGQNFSLPSYFHPRPSAAGPGGYDPTASGGSNLAPTNRKLIEAAQARLKVILRENPETRPEEVPIDAITASGSGLDPHISPAYARLQAPRIARERGLSQDQVLSLINRHTEQPFLGVIGEPAVNVLLLNRDLDNGAAGTAENR